MIKKVCVQNCSWNQFFGQLFDSNKFQIPEEDLREGTDSSLNAINSAIYWF